MNQRETEKAIEAEVAHWPGATVSFEAGGKHPKWRLEFGGLIMRQAFPGTSGTSTSLLKTLADVRRALRKMDATRDTEATEADDQATVESVYHKPNPGREMRPDPVEAEKVEPRPTMADQLAEHPAAPKPRLIEEVKGLFGDVIGYVETELTEEEKETRRAEIQAAVAAIVDGIYFGLSADVYHAVPRLSASGLQKLAVSPATFWKGSWFDPNRPELDEEATKAQILGKAYHTARLEPQLFDSLYCRALDKADFPTKGFLSSDAAVKAALKEAGETQSISGETIVERAERLLDTGYEGTIWPLEKARWLDQVGSRIPIVAKIWDELITDMERLRANDEVAELLMGGEAEVSIFWTDQHGLQMKARVDYLKPDLWDDFKTFDNSRGKELEQALADALRFNRYHVQAVTYRDAVEAIRVGGLQIVGDATDAQRKLVAAIQIRPDELACWYIFQEKGGVPNLLAMEFPFFDVPMNTRLGHAGASEEAIARVEATAITKTGLHIRAVRDIDKAKRNFALYSQVYPSGVPWAPIHARRRFEDANFNRYWLEGYSE